MITIIDLNRELAKLNTLRGRTPQTTSAERTGSAARLAPYRDGAIFSSKFAGKGDWERHPNGDEFVQIIDGAASLEIVPLDGPRQRVELKAGTLAIVPQGAWHRFQSADGITLITATPQPSEHVRLDVDDPRTAETQTSQVWRTTMVAILDLKDTLGKMPMMRGRRPESTEAERKATGAFVTLAPFRDGNIYSARFSGDAAWERHPNGDELVQIVDGSCTVHLMTDDGLESHEVGAGTVIVVPQNTWHRFHAPNGVSIVTATPRPTEHLTVDVEDPRMLSDAERAANSEEKVR